MSPKWSHTRGQTEVRELIPVPHDYYVTFIILLVRTQAAKVVPMSAI